MSKDVPLSLALQDNYIVDAKLASFASAYDLGRNPKL